MAKRRAKKARKAPRKKRSLGATRRRVMKQLDLPFGRKSKVSRARKSNEERIVELDRIIAERDPLCFRRIVDRDTSETLRQQCEELQELKKERYTLGKKVVTSTKTKARRELCRVFKAPGKLRVKVCEGDDNEVEIEHNGVPLANLVMEVSRYGVKVGWVETKRYARKHGIGTKLYEIAAAVACAVWGKPLESDRVRSPFAEAFWQKQEKKGRAKCVARRGRESNGGDYYHTPVASLQAELEGNLGEDRAEVELNRILRDLPKPEGNALGTGYYWDCEKYTLSCPAPKSLAGIKLTELRGTRR